MPDGAQYQQIRRRLEPVEQHVSPLRIPDIMRLPVPTELRTSDLADWARCLINILPMPYQIIAFQTWIDFVLELAEERNLLLSYGPPTLEENRIEYTHPELIPAEELAVLAQPANIVASVIEADQWHEFSSSRADQILQDSIIQGVPSFEPQERQLYQRWQMLNDWWNTTLQRIPLLATGIRLDPGVLENYRSVITSYVENYQREAPNEYDDYGYERWIFERAVKLLLSLDITPEEVLSDWIDYNLPLRWVVDRLEDLGKTAPLRWSEISPVVFILLSQLAEEITRRPHSAPDTHGLVKLLQQSTLAAQQKMLGAVLTGELVLDDQEIEISNTQEQLQILWGILRDARELYSDELVEYLMQTYPPDQISNHNDLPLLVRILGEVQTPATRDALLQILDYQYNIRFEGRLPFPQAWKPEVVTNVINLLGRFTDPESREIYISLWPKIQEMNQLKTYLPHFITVEERELVRDWLEESYQPEEGDLFRASDLVPAIAVVSKIPDLELIGKVLLAWSQRPVGYPNSNAVKAAQDAIEDILGEEAGDEYIESLGLEPPRRYSAGLGPIVVSDEPARIQRDIETAFTSVAEPGSEEEKRWERIFKNTEKLKKRKFPIPPDLMDLLIDIWEAYVNYRGDIKNPFVIMDLEDVDARNLTEEQQEDLMEDPELQEWANMLDQQTYKLTTILIEFAQLWPTPKSEQWLNNLQHKTPNCGLWKRLVVEPVEVLDQWGESVW